MKKLLTFSILAISIAGFTQNVANKRVTYKIDEESKIIYLDSVSSQKSYIYTGYMAMYKGKSYAVYQSSKGKKFIFLISKKSGKQYRKYID